jgi:hypothetical protein
MIPALALRIRGARSSAVSATKTLDPRLPNLDTSGFGAVLDQMNAWGADASLKEVAQVWDRAGYRGAEMLDARLTEREWPEQASTARPGRARGAARDPLADERHRSGFRGHRRRPVDRGDRIRHRIPAVGRPADPAA